MTLGSIVKAPLGSDTGVITRAALGPHRAAVHVARGGPLYRASSQPRATTAPGAPPRRQRREPPRRAPLTESVAMLDSSADALLRALNRAYTRRPVLAIVLGTLLGLALIEGVALGASTGATLVFGAMAMVTLVVVGRREMEYYSEAVEYELDDHVAHKYRRLVTAFNRMRFAGPVWHMGRRTGRGDRRRRRLVMPTLALPPRVRSNIRVPALRAGRQTLYFFPDRVLVYDAQMAWGISYHGLKVKGGDIREVGDGSQGGGSAECNGYLALASDSGLSALFRCTDPKAAAEVAAAVEALA